MQTATVDPLVGRTLEGRYRILGRIARGGMSTVYQAVDERLDRSVAVKVMSAALSADPAFSDRFSREARAAARLTHINAVAVYDQGTDASAGTHVFLVMELVDGRTLRDLMRERGRFSPAEALSIMEPMLSALAAAHRAGIVHRDVKPENILLSDSGVVKVADFGLARAIEADAESTRTGLMMGTVAYCSPEQISRGEADQRSDVYSAGVVLFEMLTGAAPYKGESAMNVAYQHVHSRVPAPSSRVKGIPSEIDELVVNATDSDPTGRPADAAEFLAEIAEARAELSLPVVPIPPRERRRPGENRSTDATEVIGAAGARHDTRLVPGRGPRQPGQERDVRDALPPPPIVIPPARRKPRTEKQRRRRRGFIMLFIIVLLGAAAGAAGWWFAAGRYSTVPQVRGQSLSQAEQALQASGYKIGATKTAFDHTVPAGEVTITSPSSGDRLERGKAVSITVSQGKDMVAVPSVSPGSTQQEAQAAFQAAGLAVNPVPTQQFSTPIAAGGFLGSSPAAGTKVERGYTTITLYVSKGPDWVSVPAIAAGTPFADAQAALTAAGFTVAQTEAFSDTVDKGKVISVSPADRQVRGQTVTVTVSNGPQMVTIPKIKNGTSSEDASAQLQALGLQVHLDTSYDGGLFDRVVGVDPKAGTRVQVGSVVTLLVV